MFEKRRYVWADSPHPFKEQLTLVDSNYRYGGHCVWCLKPISRQIPCKVVHTMRMWDEWTVAMGTWKYDREKQLDDCDLSRRPETISQTDNRVTQTMKIVNLDDEEDPLFLQSHPHTMVVIPMVLCQDQACLQSFNGYMQENHSRCMMCREEMNSDMGVLHHVMEECSQRICWRCDRRYALLDGNDLVAISTRLSSNSAGSLAARELGTYRPELLSQLKVNKITLKFELLSGDIHLGSKFECCQICTREILAWGGIVGQSIYLA
jgi:hypothetical protein